VSTLTTWREDARQDKLVRAQIERDDEASRVQARIAEREAALRVKLEGQAARRAAKAAAREDRAARLSALAGWVDAHVTDLLFVPVIGVPAVLSWTAMSSFGAKLYGPPGYLLPAFSEGAMWAFAAAVTITLRRYPDRPVWHLRAGIAVFALFGAALNFLHGLATSSPLFPGLPSGPITGGIMAAISVAGVVAHQLITAGPNARRAERAPEEVTEPVPEAAPEPASESTPETAPESVTESVPASTPKPRTRSTRKATPKSAPKVTPEVHFADEIASGELPSIRRIRSELHVGQDRGKEILAELTSASQHPASLTLVTTDQ
jgi:hypothetical protein